eukprot:802636_1
MAKDLVSIVILLGCFCCSFMGNGGKAEAAVSRSSSQKRWTLSSLESECDNDMASTRICDPEKIFGSSSSSSSSSNNEHESFAGSSIDQITSAIHELESNHPLICSNGMATSTVSTTIPTTTTEVQMAIVAIPKMKLSHENFVTDDKYMIQQGKNMAVALHNHWGVGNIQCGGSGILIFLSIQDRVVYISTSNGLKSILTKMRIDHIVDDVMKPYLREEDYTGAVLQAIRCIQNYIDKGPPSMWERYIPLFLSMLPLVIGGGFMFHGRRLKKEYNTVHSKLSKIDHDKALALMGKYKCHSCPICLEDFVPKKKDGGVRVRGPKKNKSDEDGVGGADGDERKDKDKGNEKESLLQDTQQEYLGSDGREIQLLRCGHAFDKTCWETWTATPSRNIYQCPICKQDIREDQSSTLSDSESSARNSQGSGFARMRPVIPNGSQRQDNNAFGGGTSSGMFHRQQRNSINYRMYQLERNFRLQRMHFHHPRYIHQSQVDRWVRGDNGGSINDSLVQDADFVRSDPDRVPNNNNSSSSRYGSGSSSSFSSYGGGRSGGGGGGRW